MQCSCVNVARDWEKRQNAFFSLFLKGMLSQAILQMAGSKRAQVDLARIILFARGCWPSALWGG